MLHLPILQLLLISIIFVFVNPTAATERLHDCRLTENPQKRILPVPPFTCYKCVNSECDDPCGKTCDGALHCFTHIEIVEGNYLYREKGCFSHPFVVLWYCNDAIESRERNETNPLKNCCRGDFCNGDGFPVPSIPDLQTPSSKTKGEQTEEFSLTGGIKSAGLVIPLYAILVLIFIFTIACACVASVRITASYMKKPLDGKKPHLLARFFRNFYDNNAFDGVSIMMHDELMSSGSGSRLPTLNQRCLSQDVTLIKCIGQGHYGEVWQGTKLGENVAVKIFSSTDEASWQNEVNIYTDIALYHENVLGFKGSAVASRFGVTEMWLLTAFHEQGSLYDYLLNNTITHKQMMEFVRSSCAGIIHLHTEVVGSKGKPAIAHRDLKTRNILLTSHGTCVIADFGLAVVRGKGIPSTHEPINYRVGTKRYMAPEVLNETINIHNFDSFKRADMYAFAMILWEVCSRCITDGTVEAYRLPFDDCVPSNPDFEDMQKVVCIESKRPEILDRWLSDETLNAMVPLMKMCWHENPIVRYSALRVMKTLERIQELQTVAQLL